MGLVTKRPWDWRVRTFSATYRFLEDQMGLEIKFWKKFLNHICELPGWWTHPGAGRVLCAQRGCGSTADSTTPLSFSCCWVVFIIINCKHKSSASLSSMSHSRKLWSLANYQGSCQNPDLESVTQKYRWPTGIEVGLSPLIDEIWCQF